ncbi:hypothetical protein ACLKA6_002456 [Drosophila palustris]
MDAAPVVAPHAANEAKPVTLPPAPAAAAANENGVQTAAKKSETTTVAVGTGSSEMHSNVEAAGKVPDAQKTKLKTDLPTEKVLITICSADRKNKKTFMSLPSRKDVIEKAHKFGLAGNTIVLESNGCEICEDEVLLFAAKEKILLMLLAESDEYVILPPPSPLNRSERAGSSLDPSFVSNANDSTVSNDETLSLASVTPSNSKTSTAQFKEFSIPWSKVPNDIMKLLRSKTSLGKRLNTLANLLVDSLRERSAHIPIRVFREVAQQAAEKYPDSLLEKDREGQQIATSPQSLISKMINRNNALNRPQKRASSGSSDTHITSSNKKRKSGTGAAGGLAANGKSMAINRDLEEKRELLISSYRGSTKVEPATIAEYMKECFPLQRVFFNNSEKIPDITAIKENWPYIFNKDLLYQHFELLMSIDPRLLEKRFASERERIFKFFKTSKNKKVSALEENNANVVRGLAYHFNEDPDYIFKQIDSGPLSKDVLQHMNPTNAPWVALVNTPAAAGTEAQTAQTEAMVYIEGQIMSTFAAADVDLPDIIAQLLCYYYTFNMMYPKEANQTLEFIVIYFLQHAPEQARNSKKSVTSNSKFNQLIAKLANANG